MTRMIGNDGKWEFTNGVPPTFDRGEHWEEDSDDDDVADLADGAAGATTGAAESDATAKKTARTVTGDAAYNVDWNGIVSSDDPTLATPRLLHSARTSDGGGHLEVVGTTLAEQCDLAAWHGLRHEHRRHV